MFKRSGKAASSRSSILRRGPQEPLPTIEDAAKFYKANAGMPVDKFLETRRVRGDNKVRAAED